ncbi:MAG: hypothetical protein QUV21_12365, partial [Tabrizicola sp.]|nr:hypothetical protein [Tabrizicola sp.]
MKFLRSIFGKTDEEPVNTVAPVEVGPDPVMAALAELEVKRLREALAAVTPPPTVDPEPDTGLLAARPSRVVKSKVPLPEGASGPAVNIWDLDDADEIPARPAAAVPAADPVRRRPTRTKTRILGFEAESKAVVSLFEEPETPIIPVAPPAPGQGHVMFPAGWLVVKTGPGQGAAFSLS